MEKKVLSLPERLLRGVYLIAIFGIGLSARGAAYTKLKGGIIPFIFLAASSLAGPREAAAEIDARPEGDYFPCGNLHLLAGLRVPSRPGVLLPDLE